jgi:hypothetical protein
MARRGRSRACAAFAAITAGGEFHPALRTLAPALGRSSTDSRQDAAVALSRKRQDL